jgi:hypothetical protein
MDAQRTLSTPRLKSGRLSFACIGIATLFASSSGFSAENTRLSVGAMGGISFPSSASGTFGWGATAVYRFLPKVMAGIFYYRNGIGFFASSGASSLSANTTNSFYGLEGLYVFDGGFHAGARTGLIGISNDVTATDSVNTVTINTGSNPFFIGPFVGYDHPIDHFSIGGDVSYLFTFNSVSPKFLTFLLTFKLHL